MEFTVYGYEGNPRTRILRIIAAHQDIKINLETVVPRQYTNVETLLEQFPRSYGKIPSFKGDNIKLTEVPAIAFYLAKLKPSTLLGDGSLEQEAEVMSWVTWANMELLIVMAKWFLPLCPDLKRPVQYNKDSVAAGKTAALAFLDKHEARMQGVEYLVGNDITLADIFVAIYISRGMQYILGKEWRDSHPNTMAHFERVAAWGPTKQIVPQFEMIDVELPNENPYA